MGKLDSCTCSHFSVLFLVIINAAIGIGGLITIGLSGYAFANFAEFEGLISQEVIIYSLSVGIILFLLSLIAIFGALNRMKKLLVFYILMLLLLTATEIVIVVVGLEYIGVIAGASDADTGGSASLSNRESFVNDFLLRTYHTCCVIDAEVCDSGQADPNFCLPVQACATPGVEATDVCIIRDDSVLPLDPSVCTAFEKIDGALIAPPTEGGCGGGQPDQFLTDVITLIEGEFSTLGAVFATLIGLEFLLILFTMFIILGKKIDYDTTPWGDAAEAVVVAEPVPREELERMSRRSARPVSFATSGVTTGNRNRQSLNASRVSQQRRSNQRASARQRPVSSAVSVEPEGTPRPTSAEDPPPAAPARSVVSSVSRQSNRPQSIARERIMADPEVINDIL